MVGWVDAMEPQDYANWVSGGGGGGNLAAQGQQIFLQNGCSTCHLFDQQGRCPNLRGLYNKEVELNDGRRVIADDAYIRESILDPNAKVVAGFERDIMPEFKGQLSEENVIQLIAYIKSLSPTAPASQHGSQQPPVVLAPTGPSGQIGTPTGPRQ
jgi:cytochrome c oxidase subunit II